MVHIYGVYNFNQLCLYIVLQNILYQVNVLKALPKALLVRYHCLGVCFSELDDAF